MTGNIKSGPDGFTLLESLTALAIFALTVVAVLNLYLLFFRSQQEVKQRAQLEADGRHILNSIVQGLETGTLDYDYYGGAAPPNPLTLGLVTPERQTERFRLTGTTVQACAARPPTDPCDDLNPNHWSALNDPAHSQVIQLLFRVSPNLNPFERAATGQALSNQQPLVTILLTITDPSGQALALQTSFTSRAYER